MGHGDVRAERFKIHLHFRGYEYSPISIHINYSNLEIHGILQLEWYYQRAMFSPGDIRDMHEGIVNILSDALKYPVKKIERVEWMTNQEKQRILFQFNDAEKPYPLDKTFPELFREQVEKNPDNVALVGKEEGWKSRKVEGKKEEEPFGQILNAFGRNISITYRELNEKSNRLACVLRSKGVELNTIVGIMTEPSVEMIIGLLGILKAGGAYLPIEPGYPGDRIEYMIKESGTKILLTGNSLYPFDIPGSLLPCVLVSHPSDLAYVIYTSGSTGRPKGVLVEHGNLMAYLMAFENQFTLTPDDTVIQQSSFVFDAFVEELYPILLKGGVLAIPGKDGVKDIARLVEFMVRHRATVITASPLLLNELNKAVAAGVTGLCIRIYISGGDVLNGRYIDELLQTGEVYNTYGPTESTVCAAYYKCEEEVPFNVPIGKPIANYNVYILDKKKRLLPVGIGGELCVSGPGVTRGYLNNPGLTAEKFCLCPPGGAFEKLPPGPPQNFLLFTSFITHHRSIIYKTGDLSRWLEDGNIQFLGRIDTQVKIRGYRIEPGEIENQLLTHEAINEAVVIPREHPSADKYLCAYIVLKNPGSINISALKEYLAVELPDYMIPPFFVELERIPLTPNGKLNRKLLPEPEMGALTAYYAAPRDPVEKKLAELWQEILEVDRIGIDDHFFQLGGHSLKAIILISRMNKAFHVTVPLAEIFRTPTIRGLSAYIKSKKKGLFTPIESVEEKEYHALSSAQKRLYILHQMDEGSTSYNMPYALRLEGEVNKNKLEEIFLMLIARHESLRTSFRMLDGVPIQRIHDDVEFHHDLHDLQDYHDFLRSFIRPFDLSQAPLLRVGLTKTDEKKHLLVVDMHHIISDGISRRLLVKEFMALAASKDLPRLRLQYKDFSEWQNSEAQRKALIKQKAYWKTHLEGEIPVLHLPTDYVRPTIQRFEGSCVTFEIDRGEMKKLQSLALAEGITLYMILLAIYYILLSKLSNQEDILVGTPTVGRRHADLEQIIGMFVNTLVLRNYPTGDKTYRGFLKEIKKRSLQAFENQDYPYEELVEELSIARDASRNPLFDTMFVMQNIGIPGIEIPGLQLTPYEHQIETSKFDLTMIGMEVEEKLLLTFEYSTNLFKKATIERFIAYFKKIVSAAAANWDVKICDVEILLEEERRELLYDFNNTTVNYPKDKTIHQLFDEQVEKTPDNIAVVGTPQLHKLHEEGTRELAPLSVHVTYKELNQKSNQLTHLLMKKGIGPDTIVAIMLKRSIEMVIGILGILKAGGAYLPIDPDYPGERKTFMLDDSNAHVLLTSSPLVEERRFKFKGEIFSLDDLSFYSDSGKEADRGMVPGSVNKAGDWAYIMYTSGSTGRPKGVLVEHRNVVRLVVNTNYVELTGETRILQTGAPVFDATTFEIWGALLNGGQLLLVEKEVILEAHRLGQVLKANKINTLWLTSPLFNQLARENCEIFSTLDYLLVGGDVLSPEFINLVRDKNKALKIINGYGPTENTTFSTTFLIERDFEKAIPIGSPIGNSKAFILDRYGKLQPIGILGELWVGGDGVSRGYLNNPELTAEKFILAHSSWLIADRKTMKGVVKFPMSYQLSAISYIYKTGDLARWLSNGNIEFLGRIDQQAKIRGFRIEPGEIENCLLKHGSIKEAVVLTRKDSKKAKYLCAYIVSDIGFPVSELREHLAINLPAYMIPSYFVVLEKMPLTPHGKIDRQALPEPEATTGSEAYTAPRNEIEEKLAEMWSEILGIEKGQIGIDDNFFRLGGHSLKAAILISMIHKILNVKISLAEIFKTPTVRGLSQLMRKAPRDKYTSIEPTEKKEFYELSYNQKRLWIINQMEPESSSYNLHGIILLKHEVESKILKKVLDVIINRHESFRTCFRVIADEPVQLVAEHVEIPFKTIDISSMGKEKEEKRTQVFVEVWRTPFDLTRVPLFRSVLVRLDEQEYELIFCMHHIISDGWSMELLKKEFFLLYEEYGNSKEIEPEPLQLQYKDFVEWQNKQINNPGLKQKSHQFWNEKLEKLIPPLELFTDFIANQYDRAGAGYTCVVTKDTKDKIKDYCEASNTSLFIFLFSVFNVLLSRLSRQEDITCNIISAGREDISMQNIVGFFVQPIVQKTHVDAYQGFSDFLGKMKIEILKTFEYQGYPLELVLEELKMKYPEVSVAFNMLNIQRELTELEPGNFNSYHTPQTQDCKFDIEWYIIEYKNGIQTTCSYKKSMFKHETIEYIVNEYLKLLNEILENPGGNIKDFNVFCLEELDIKGNLVKTAKDFARFVKDENQSIVSRFEEQVNKYSRHIAVKAEGGIFTYMELNVTSNRIARAIGDACKRHPWPGAEGVALLFDHGAEMIAAILGVLKSANYYIPLDTSYPSNRLIYILNDSNASILLTNNRCKNQAENLINKAKREINLIDIGIIHESVPGENLDLDISPRRLAYILYTSGSTGVPKGVIQDHGNVMHFIRVYTNNLHIQSNDRLTLFSSYSFDAAVMDIYGALLNGATLYPFKVNQGENLDRLPHWLREEQITIFHSIPTLYRYFTGILKGDESFPDIRLVVMGGEEVLKQDVERYKKYFSDGCLFINGLGPTESTVTLQYVVNKETEISREVVPVGFPVDQTEVYVIDDENREAGVFGAGEIVYKSDYLALGYCNNPGETHEVFTKNPISKEGRIFRSADLGRRLQNGSIEYIGRKDYQVKIRGYRVEQGEIESIIDRVEGIKKSVVVCRQNRDGESCLVAYYMEEKEKEPDEKALIGELKQLLPDFMIPAVFINIKELPLTPSGKINRKVLPVPEIQVSEEYIAPRNGLEKKLVEIWREVLGIEKEMVSIDADFFALGGHSLKAASMVSRIHKELNLKLSLADVFKTPTVRGISGTLKKLAKIEYSSIRKAEEKEYYLLSSAQKRLYILQQMDVDNVSYNMPNILYTVQETDKEKLEETFKKIIARHESLRTSFEIINEEPVQRVHKEVRLKIEYYDLTTGDRGQTTDDGKKRTGGRSDTQLSSSSVIRHLSSGFVRPFDLSQAPLLRVGLIKTTGKQDILMVDIHHIITDAASQSVLKKQFMRLYAGEEIPPPKLQYRDYSQWQNSQTMKEVFKQQEKYWVRQFSGEIPVLSLPPDYARPTVQSFEGSRIRFEIGKEETAALDNIGRSRGAALFMVLMAVYNIFLSRISGQEDIVVGIPTAGRKHTDLEDIIGMFVNTLAVRNYPVGNKTVREFFEEVKERTLEDYENQEYPFEELVEKISVSRDTSRNPLFDVMLNLLYQTDYSDPGDTDTLVDENRKNNYENITAKFDLTLMGVLVEDKLILTFEYSTKLFKKDTIERYITYLKKIVISVVENPGIKISEIEIITGEEKQQILYHFNDTRADYPRDKTIHQLFEEQAEKTPDHTALVGKEEGWKGRRVEGKKAEGPSGQVLNAFGEMHLSYRELYEKSDRLALMLIEKGVRPDTIVALLVERSVEMIIGILGILKAGGAYLPIDPQYPQERIDYMLEDSSAKILLTGQEIANFSSPQAFKTRLKGPPSFGIWDLEFGISPRQGGQLAYLIYTSGSTGEPKGVMVEHGHAVAYVNAFYTEFTVSSGDVFLQQTAYVFDVFVEEVFTTFLKGGKLAVPGKEEIFDVHRLSRFIAIHGVTIISCSPFLLKELNHQDTLDNLGTVRYFISGGDVLKANYIDRLLSIGKVYNAYGPTEATIGASYYPYRARAGLSIPIGKPIANYNIYILDRYDWPVPMGIRGELCITGAGVARGYLNRIQLTLEKFKANPFIPGERMYKTGDLARWLPDGNIEFLGRVDHQVQIRGFRIELGEIENQLQRHSEIKEAIASLREDQNGDKYICAYIVFINDFSPPESELRKYLAQQLPTYMIPSDFVILDTIPLTPNGKIDRKALPAPKLVTERDHVPPRNEIEKKLSLIWSEVLSHPQVGIDDNFFQLGGHSLKATILISMIHKILNVKISIAEIFKKPTIRELAAVISAPGKEDFVHLEEVEKKEYYQLSFNQKRLWTINQLEPNNSSFNMPNQIVLAHKVCEELLEELLHEIIKRHESFRTGFKVVKDNPVQFIVEKAEIPFKIIDLSSLSEKEKQKQRKHVYVNEVNAPFDLTRLPLFRSVLVKMNEEQYEFIFNMQHIISDGWSMDILRQEFYRLYDARKKGMPCDMKPLRIQYKDYAAWQNQLLADKEKVGKAKEFWKNYLMGTLPRLDLPYDFSPGPGGLRNKRSSAYCFVIEEGITRGLNSFARQQKGSLFMVLLASFNILLSHITGQEEILMAVPAAARQHGELRHIIGMFVNTLILGTQVNMNETFIDLFRTLQTNTFNVLEFQDYPLESIFSELKMKYPEIFVFFNMVNVGISQGEQLTDLNSYHIEEVQETKFDMVCYLTEYKNAIQISCHYFRALFRPETIERIMRLFTRMLENISRDPGKKAKDYCISKKKKNILRGLKGNLSNKDKITTIVHR